MVNNIKNGSRDIGACSSFQGFEFTEFKLAGFHCLFGN